MNNYLTIFWTATKLGLTSFGGPTAHLGFFQNTYVEKKKWLSNKEYADLVALSQVLPGPASSQVGMGIGFFRGGIIGGILSFIGFTLPSVLLLMFFALFLNTTSIAEQGFIHGLKIVAVVVVLQALLAMAKNLAPDRLRQVIVLMSLIALLTINHPLIHIFLILLAGVIGYFSLKIESKESGKVSPIKKRTGLLSLILFFSLLLFLPLLAIKYELIDFFDRFYRAGALVFGGGHVVLPLLENEFVQTGLIKEDIFLAGYGLTQAVPGPLFTFASYLGTVMHGVGGGILATIAIFLPAFLLILGVLPFWHGLSQSKTFTGAIAGMNAAVVGILLATFYQPIWTGTITEAIHFALFACLFYLFHFIKIPAWSLVCLGILTGFIFL